MGVKRAQLKYSQKALCIREIGQKWGLLGGRLYGLTGPPGQDGGSYAWEGDNTIRCSKADCFSGHAENYATCFILDNGAGTRAFMRTSLRTVRAHAGSRIPIARFQQLPP